MLPEQDRVGALLNSLDPCLAAFVVAHANDERAPGLPLTDRAQGIIEILAQFNKNNINITKFYNGSCSFQ